MKPQQGKGLINSLWEEARNAPEASSPCGDALRLDRAAGHKAGLRAGVGEMDGFNIHLNGAWATVPHELFIPGSATASASHRPEAQSSWGSPAWAFRHGAPPSSRENTGRTRTPNTVNTQHTTIIPINEPLELIHSVSPITASTPGVGGMRLG